MYTVRLYAYEDILQPRVRPKPKASASSFMVSLSRPLERDDGR